jgi:hypothetical protein
VETFSDIDDDEIDGYMATAEEVELKTVIWSEMNKCAPSCRACASACALC